MNEQDYINALERAIKAYPFRCPSCENSPCGKRGRFLQCDKWKLREYFMRTETALARKEAANE